jgi:thiol-disulfide isomerase/thioredoxin
VRSLLVAFWIVVFGAVAVAAATDPRGWTSGGTVAVDSARMLAGMPESPAVPFPGALTSQIDGPTVLFYFSPRCPHCQHVAREIEALHQRLRAEKTGSVLGISSGGPMPEDLKAFEAEYGITFPVIVDTDRSILEAMSIKSTPSAMFVVPAKPKGHLRVVDLWYPYLPGFDVLVAGRAAGDPWTMFRPGEYLGTNTCGMCHGQEHASWQLTWHSAAWATLRRLGHDTDAACTGCHVTGAGRATGWMPGGDDLMVDVGCEACHGPGGPHDGERTDAATTCVACHDADHSIAFSYEKGLPLIDHYASLSLTEEERTTRRRELHRGEADRPLLAFNEGDNAGSQACRACHTKAYDSWASGPHAAAMSSLATTGRDDPTCVRCHATGKATTALPPTTMSGFDVLNGVGCESCHGPGATHVAAKGGADNIQGLGDSCPVCVVEALCTSCHTPSWSPAFDLDEGLARIRHGD